MSDEFEGTTDETIRQRRLLAEQLRKDFQWKFERNGNPGED